MKATIQAILVWYVAAGAALAYGRTLHVDAQRGNDSQSGLSADQAFGTIQRAADVVQPGDEVVIHPGVYFERVKLRNKGQEHRPIIFRADAIASNRVVLTGADRDLREGRSAWTLANERLRVYSTPFRGDIPARVLYSGADLYPYASLQSLQEFATEFGPAPRQGYYYDQANGQLCVRLHESGDYGPDDPRRHVIAASPAEGMGFEIRGAGDAHVVIEGITFETPGNSAIFTEASHVDVRRCWFVGCPYAVRGTRRSQPGADGSDDSASHVSISYCDFHEWPAFDDCEELLELRGATDSSQASWADIWHRKTTGALGMPNDRKNYENGIAAHIGQSWEIHHNYIHDAFEGVANDGMTWSTDVQIHDNVFARLCDNAVEVEDHARRASIYRNLVVDVFEPFSYQPLSGPPWPGPIFIYDNVVINSPRSAAIWEHSFPNGSRGVFKVGISKKNWLDGKNSDVPQSPLITPGLYVFNNSIFFAGGGLISLLGSKDIPLEGVVLANNYFETEKSVAAGGGKPLVDGHFAFRSNSVAAMEGVPVEEARMTAGAGGQVVDRRATIQWPAREPSHDSVYVPSMQSSQQGEGVGASSLSELLDISLRVGPKAP